MVTREVKARFVNGRPSAIEATYTWKNLPDFERFMRFAQRYAEDHGLGFTSREGQGAEAGAGEESQAGEP
jgi:photosystem II protein